MKTSSLRESAQPIQAPPVRAIIGDRKVVT